MRPAAGIKTMRDARRLALLAVVAAFFAVLAFPVSARADTMGKAQVRLVDLSSDSQTADFYIDGQKAWSNVGYKNVSNYIQLDASNHTFDVRAQGSPADSKPLAHVQQSFNPDGYYSVITAGWLDDLKATVLDDGSMAMPAPDYCQARFINAAAGSKSIDIIVHGLDAHYSNLSFMGASTYVKLPKGTYDIEFQDSATHQVIFTAKNFVAPGGHMHSIAAAGGIGSPVEAVEFFDAMTADQVPQGAAHTGMGGISAGTAGRSPLGIVPPGAIPFAVLGTMLLIARQPRTKR
jgi:Domain of unknown function (DUF4397)